MSLCQSIDTLAMAYLDDELVAEERRELELHLLSCAACKAHVEVERAELAIVRKALAPPPAPPALVAAIQRMLDDEDRRAVRAVRRRWTQFFLPGSAGLAAAAALAVFVLARPASDPAGGPVATEAVRVQSRHSMPLEVQGAATGPWLQKHFEPSLEPPQFTGSGIQLLGARLTAVAGHDAALLRYEVTASGRRAILTAVVIDGLRGHELSGGVPVRVREHTLYLHDIDGTPAVTYVDQGATSGRRIGYTFASSELRPQELLELVVSTDLVARATERR